MPAGHIPRSMTVHAHGDLARQANPGDVVILTGIFLPTPYTGFRALRAGLVADTYLETMRMERVKKNFDEFQVTPEMLEQIEALKNGCVCLVWRNAPARSLAFGATDSQVYDKLSKSIAPEIFGMTDVKRALLLQLVGGVTRKMSDGMLIRGDINICLVGDPGVAKSQLLKYISTVAPRGVYTTGKGSSGVGLTAAVMRDPLTNEMILGARALFPRPPIKKLTLATQRAVRWCSPTTASAASTSLTRWRTRIGRPSTK